MPAPEVTPTSGPTPTGDVLAQFSLFEAPPDDPIFASAEPFKGLRPEKEIIASLPEDARQFLQNKGLGARAKVEEANAAVKTERAARAAAEAAAEEWKKKAMGAPVAAPGPVADPELDPRLAALYGLAAGDPWKDRPAPTVEDDADDLSDLDDAALADPAKMREILLRIRKQAAVSGATTAITTARGDIADVSRAAAKPAFAAREAERARAAQTEAERKTAEFRASHAGLDTDEGFGAFYGYTRELVGHTGEGWPTGVNLSVAHKAWAATRSAPAPAAPAAEVVPAASPPKPKSEVDLLAAALRQSAQRAQGSGGVAQSEAALVMPKHVQDDPVAMGKWVDAHPRAKRAFAANDREEIARIMGRTPRA